MCTYKYIIFYILFLIVMPFKVIIAQETSADSAIDNELEDKYNSVISKAAFSLTGAQYKQAVDYYKEASLLRPAETFPNKMIKYVETIMADVAAKQKRAERAQIRDNLNKANKAIIDKSWDSARILFSEILTLNPEKSDEEYAKSKIQAIDLELERITARIPAKEEPKPVIMPKNRREARAQRKMAERNTALAAKGISPKPTQAPLPANTVIVAPSTKEIPKKAAADSLPRNNAAVAAVSTKAIPPKAIESPLPGKNAAVTPATKESPIKAIEAPAPQKSTPVASPETPESPQKSIEISLPATNPAIAAPKTGELPGGKSTEAPPRRIEAPSPEKNVAIAAPVTKEVPQRSSDAIPPAQNITTVAPATREVPPKSTETTQKITPPATATEVPQKPIEAPLPETGTSSLSKEIPDTSGALSLKLSDSSDYIKLICQDISFIGTNAYIKVLIQNYSATESYHTDTLQVSIKKNDGNVKKLEQRFISGFPVILPQKELILVSFAEASTSVAPDDIFILEMNDKMKKTKLALQIPWALYKQQKPL